MTAPHPSKRKRKRFGLADGEQTSYDKVASDRNVVASTTAPPDPTRPGGVDESGDSSRSSIGLAPVVHHLYAELAG
jgi:hypothetical protein